MTADEIAQSLRAHIRELEVVVALLEGDDEGPITVEAAEDLVRARERWTAAKLATRRQPSFLTNAREAGILLLQADFERDHLSWGKRRHFWEQREATRQRVNEARLRQAAGE